MLRGFAQFQNVGTHTYHPEAPFFKLGLTLLAEVGHLIKYELTGQVVTLALDVRNIANHLAALVHIEQHRVLLVLANVKPFCQYPRAVAV